MKKLKELRNKNKFSYNQMGSFLGISKAFYWQIENRQRRMTYEMAIKIAEIFKLKPDQLFYEDFKEIIKNKNIQSPNQND